MKHIAVYAGSFDPVTNGHIWMIKRGMEMFDELIVAVGINPSKKYLFSSSERVEMLTESIGEADLNADPLVCTVGNEYLFKWAKRHDATHLLRGIRSATDFEYEKTLCEVNRSQEPSLTTVFLVPPPEIACVSSSFVKGLVGYNGWEDMVRQYVPTNVLAQFLAKHLQEPHVR